MILFHFTSLSHYKVWGIEEDGYIDVTESNIKSDGSGPRVVWLTNDPNREAHIWKNGSAVDKTQVLIVVRVDNPFWWPEWSKEQGIDEEWYDTLAKSGGHPHQWYVYPNKIYKLDWLTVIAYDKQNNDKPVILDIHPDYEEITGMDTVPTGSLDLLTEINA